MREMEEGGEMVKGREVKTIEISLQAVFVVRVGEGRRGRQQFNFRSMAEYRTQSSLLCDDTDSFLEQSDEIFDAS